MCKLKIVFVFGFCRHSPTVGLFRRCKIIMAANRCVIIARTTFTTLRTTAVKKQKTYVTMRTSLPPNTLCINRL